MTTENTTTTTTDKTPSLQGLTEKVDHLTNSASETLQKLAQRVQDETSPYMGKARELVDRAEIVYQDLRQNLGTKIEEQTAQNESAKEVIALLKEAQSEAEAALQALRHDFEQLRKAMLDLQSSSELKAFISQLLAKVFEEKVAAEEASTPEVESVEAAAETAPAKPKTTRRKKVTPPADSESAPE